MTPLVDYAAIIEKANIRKEALQAFEQKFASIREKELQLREALTYFATLGDSVAAIDMEGRALLGPIGTNCHHLTRSARSAYDTIFSPEYYKSNGLDALMEMIK